MSTASKFFIAAAFMVASHNIPAEWDPYPSAYGAYQGSSGFLRPDFSYRPAPYSHRTIQTQRNVHGGRDILMNPGDLPITTIPNAFGGENFYDPYAF